MAWFKVSYICVNSKCSEIGIEELKSRESEFGELFYSMRDDNGLKQFEVILDASNRVEALNRAILLAGALENLELDDVLEMISEYIDSEGALG